MSADGSLLVLVVAVLLIALFWRVNWKFVDPEPADRSLDGDEPQLVASQIAVAERLRREADAATDPEEKATLTTLADEAEADVDKLRREFDDGKG